MASLGGDCASISYCYSNLRPIRALTLSSRFRLMVLFSRYDDETQQERTQVKRRNAKVIIKLYGINDG
jgi:hypothetical protein